MISKIQNLFKKLFSKGHTEEDEYKYEYEDEATNETEKIESKDHTSQLSLEEEEEEEEIPAFTAKEMVIKTDDETSEIKFDTQEFAAEKIPLKDRFDEHFQRLKNKFSDKLKKRRELTKESLTAPSSSSTKKSFSEKLNELRKGNINLLEIPNLFFASAQRPMIHKVFQTAVIITVVFVLGKVTGLALKGSTNYKNIKQASLEIDFDKLFTREKLNEIKSARLFKTDKTAPSSKMNKEPVIAANIKCETASRKTSLPIKLVNTIVIQDSVKSIASVSVRSKITSFREGDKINGLARIGKIERLRLIVKNLSSGDCEFIESSTVKKLSRSPINVLSKTQSKRHIKLKKIDGIKNEGNSFQIKKDYLKSKMKDMSSLLTQARGIQINNPDGSISFKVVEIEPGGVFAYLGMQNGDIVTQINGEPISDVNQIMNIFGKITNLSNLNLTISRDGTAVEQDYSIK